MPEMSRTEMQFARLLGSTDRYVEIVLAMPPSYRSDRVETAHYERWSETSLPRRLDGLIVTGAPLELLAFEDVRYWRELVCIFDWAARNVGSSLYVCWGASAALYAFHGVRTRILPQKISGVFQQHVVEAKDPLMAGLAATFPCPVSRHAEVETHKVPWQRDLTCLAQSAESGLCLVGDAARNAYYMFNHLEYDADTLKLEYLRDRARRAGTTFSPETLGNHNIVNKAGRDWREPAETVFANWLAIIAAQAQSVRDVNYVA
ncbi:homoserine O-succinyltransferase [Labrys miyagiensis]|uniref:Homoserine O-acetyltransferase n=2 Tax=Labrys miyagiensis TaxID=346912 RepID=A0ABQ6CG32_9HYPH|nr:homoserine O-succinyltransferase [Labrys miyagiensis]